MKYFLKLQDAVREEHWDPNVLVMNEMQLNQLLLNNKFIEYEYLPSSETNLERGTIRQIIGMKVYSKS